MQRQFYGNRFKINSDNLPAAACPVGSKKQPGTRSTTQIKNAVPFAYQSVFLLDLLKLIYGSGRKSIFLSPA